LTIGKAFSNFIQEAVPLRSYKFPHNQDLPSKRAWHPASREGVSKYPSPKMKNAVILKTTAGLQMGL